MSYLEVKNLRKVFGKKDTEVVAVNDVSFSVEKGEFVAIVGASGSGKSTLLQLIGGVDKATSGSILLNGEDVVTLNEEKRAIWRRRKIGIIFQEFHLIPILNVEENIKIPVRLDGKQMKQKETDELLNLLGLSHRRHHMPDELSGGQKQRTAIGRALANHPALILADEPTGNLDRKTGLEIMALLKSSVEKYSQTLILVTHDETIASMADRIITISDGSIQSDVRIKHAIGKNEQMGGE